MSKIIPLLYILYYTGSCFVQAQQNSIKPQDMGWYLVTETSHNDLWSVGQNLFLLNLNDSNKVQFKGFTNSGATVISSVEGKRIHIPIQTSQVVPFGGKGQTSFSIIAQAEGSIGKGVLKLKYLIKNKDKMEYRGEIRAMRMASQDTTIDQTYFGWIQYDLNKNPYEIGEHYENQIKNGRWIYRDQQERIISDIHYTNDTLNGNAKFYTYMNPPEANRMEGLMINGKKVGIWYSKFRKNKWSRWRTHVILLYDRNESLIWKTITYKNGKPHIQIFFSFDGKEIWYRFYDKHGRIYIDDNKNPWNYEILIGQ